LQLVVAVLSMSDSSLDELMRRASERAKQAAGGPSALARALSESGDKASPQAVSKWHRVPAERVLEVEKLSGVSRYELRPDVYGPAPAADHQSGAAA
jgi:DNA-binding transcriptional regulator YdaS (Cro superfamily)